MASKPTAKAVKFDDQKTRLSLVEAEFRIGIAQVMQLGVNKYGKDNWKKGMEYSRVLDALYRHIAEFEMGTDRDPESGMSHLYHAACNLMFLDYFNRCQDKYAASLDDREKD